ncbi:MAG: hypothetical protein AB7K35_14785 [Pseudorhodoplanes sp.]
MAPRDKEGLEKRRGVSLLAARASSHRRHRLNMIATAAEGFAMAPKALPLLCLALAAAACQTSPPPPPASTAALQGRARADALCSGCHAIGPEGSASGTNAPPFHAIINQTDLRPDTVSAWLRDAHNYPSEMNVSLSARDVEVLVAYMLTLRDPNYRRPSD